MKKIISITLLVCLLLGGFAVSGFAAPALGDVNGDGRVGADDARLALRRSVDLEDFAPETEKYAAADYDKDGTVTAMDARAILRVSVSLPVNEAIKKPTANNQYDILRSGTYYCKGVMWDYTGAAPLELAVTKNTLYAVSEMEGNQIAILVDGKTTYMILPEKKAYLRLDAAALKLMGMDTDDLLGAGDPGFAKMQPLENATEIRETAYEGKPCYAYVIPDDGTGTGSIVYINGDQLYAIEDVAASGEVVGSLIFETVSADVPAEKRSMPSDYSRLSIFKFVELFLGE